MFRFSPEWWVLRKVPDWKIPNSKLLIPNYQQRQTRNILYLVSFHTLPGAIRMRNDVQNVRAHCHPAPPGCDAKTLPGGSGKKRFCMHSVRIVCRHCRPAWPAALHSSSVTTLPGAIRMQSETQYVRANHPRAWPAALIHSKVRFRATAGFHPQLWHTGSRHQQPSLYRQAGICLSHSSSIPLPPFFVSFRTLLR